MAMRRWRRGARGALTVIGAALATFLAGISMQVTSRAVGGAPPDTAAVVRRLPVGRLALRGGSSGAPAATASSSEDVAEAEKPDDFPHIPTDELDEDEREALHMFRDVERQYMNNELPLEARLQFDEWMAEQTLALKAEVEDNYDNPEAADDDAGPKPALNMTAIRNETDLAAAADAMVQACDELHREASELQEKVMEAMDSVRTWHDNPGGYTSAPGTPDGEGADAPEDPDQEGPENLVGQSRRAQEGQLMGNVPGSRRARGVGGAGGGGADDVMIDVGTPRG